MPQSVGKEASPDYLTSSKRLTSQRGDLRLEVNGTVAHPPRSAFSVLVPMVESHAVIRVQRSDHSRLAQLCCDHTVGVHVLTEDELVEIGVCCAPLKERANKIPA